MSKPAERFIPSSRERRPRSEPPSADGRRRPVLYGATAALALCFPAFLLGGCSSLGIREMDRSVLMTRYTTSSCRFIDLDGVTVRVRAEGSGPPILLLHGVMASLHTWDGWVEELRGDYRVIRADIPGFGLSDAAPSLDGEAIVRFIDGVLDAYDVEKVILVGNSLGGYMASYYTARAPERVEALVLISPAAYPQKMPWTLRLVAGSVGGWVFESCTPRGAVRAVLDEVYGDGSLVDEQTVDLYMDLNRAQGNREAARHVFREMLGRLDEEPEWVTSIERPTLLLWGKLDRWVPISQAERWQEDVPHLQFVAYEGVGHIAMEEIPGETTAELRRFLREAGARPRGTPRQEAAASP